MRFKLFICTIVAIGTFSLSANAEAVFSGQANLSDITNGSLTNINDTTAQINVNSGVAGATVNWNTLNIPENNTLNFYFPDANQYALNKVSNGITTIAGNVGYANGSQAGTVIFSNPNGIVCTESSFINVGSMLLTTHDVTMKDNIAQLTKQVGKDGNYHGVRIESYDSWYSYPVLKLADNLTIVSTGIDIVNARIISDKSTTMVTADGANYVLTTKETVVTQNSTVNASDVYFNKHGFDYKNDDNYNIKIANSIIKTKDSKLYLINTSENGAIKLAGNTIHSDANITAKNEVVFTSYGAATNITAYCGAGVRHSNVIKGSTTVNAPKISATFADFEEDVNFLGLKQLSTNGDVKLSEKSLYVTTYSEEMASDITQKVNAYFNNVGNFNIDIVPEVPEIVTNGVIIGEVQETVNNDIEIANKNLLSTYTNLISTNDKNTETIQKNNNLLIKAFAADDYKEDFLRNSVKKASNGNVKTTDLFKM